MGHALALRQVGARFTPRMEAMEDDYAPRVRTMVRRLAQAFGTNHDPAAGLQAFSPAAHVRRGGPF